MEASRYAASYRKGDGIMTHIVVSKIAIHSSGDKRDGYGPFVRHINDAGRMLALVKCRDNFGAMDEPLAFWPNMPTIGAFTEYDRLGSFNSHFFDRAALNPKVKFWEVLNEDDSTATYAAKADFYIQIAPEFKRRGWGLGLFSCGSGNPPYYNEDGGVSYREIARACKHMLDSGTKAILCLHEYHSSGGTIGRFKPLADYLQSVGALLPIAITEFGFETHPNDAEFMRMVKSYDPTYMLDSRVIGCATWTLGGGGWGGSNYQTALPALADYISTVQPVTPPLPDPMIRFDGQCHESQWKAVHDAATAAGAMIERV